MTVALIQIRQILRRMLRGNAAPRKRSAAAGRRCELLETRQLLSAKRSYDSVRAERAAQARGHHDHDHDHDHDDRLHVDGFPLPTGSAASGGSLQGTAPFDLAQTFQLSSLPSATKTIYLDFDGHTTSGTWWNTSFNNGAAFTTPPFSIDSDPAFSDAELERIQFIWQRVAEDFAPFNVNVTTKDPGVAGITRSGSGDTTWGIRVIVGGSWSDWFGSSAGGVAYLNTFGSSLDMGVFVFSNNLSSGEKNIAEAISHEVGHSLGLGHDGTSSSGYYTGHGSGDTGWAPIMGVGYYRELTQWSRGEYPGANNTQDDLAIITSASNGFGYRPDDYGSTLATASVLATSAPAGGVKTVNVAGIIERNTDEDWFRFTTTGGAISLNFNGAPRGSNLDIAASIYNAHGQLVITSNPANSLNASITTTLVAGTYYIMVDGVGARGLSDGYSDYGSLGQYFITGTITDNGSGAGGGSGEGGGGGGGSEGGSDGPPPAGTSSITGRIWHDANGNARVDLGDVGLAGVRVFVDSNNNGVWDPATERSALTGADGRYVISGLAAGTHRVRQVVGTGYSQVFPKSNAARSVSVSTGRTAVNIDFRSLRPPVVGNLGGAVNYTARSAAIAIAPTGTVTDADSTVFTSFRLTAQIIGGANSADRLSVLNQGRGAGQVGVSGSSLYYSGVKIGSISGGAGTTRLTITFNSRATLASIQAVLQNIAYRSTASAPAAGVKTVQFLMIESNGTAGPAVSKQIVL